MPQKFFGIWDKNEGGGTVFDRKFVLWVPIQFSSHSGTPRDDYAKNVMSIAHPFVQTVG